MDYLGLVQILLYGILLAGTLLLFVTWRRWISIPVRLGLIGLFLLYGVAPLLLGLLGTTLADQWNCVPEMGLSYVCPSRPELKDIVTGLAFMPWFLIMTIPLGLLGSLGLIIPPIIFGIQRFRQTSPASPANSSENPAEDEVREKTQGSWYRSQGGNTVVAGVCARIARRFSVNPLWVRVPFVALLVISPPIAIVLYGVLRVVMPLTPKSENS